MKVGHHVFSCRSLLLSTTVLNDTYVHTYVRTYINIYVRIRDAHAYTNTYKQSDVVIVIHTYLSISLSTVVLNSRDRYEKLWLLEFLHF